MSGGFHSRARSINTISPTRILHNVVFPKRAPIKPPPLRPSNPALNPILTDPIHSTLIYLLLKLKTQLACRIHRPSHAVYINSWCYTGRFFRRSS